MEEINERMDKTKGKLDVLGGNHDQVKRKLSRMASIIEGFLIAFKSSFKYCSAELVPATPTSSLQT